MTDAPRSTPSPPRARHAHAAHGSVTPIAILVVLLWALCFPLIIMGLQQAPPLFFAAMRALVAGMALLTVAALLRRRLPRTGRHWRIIFWIGASTTALGFLGMFHAGALLSPGLATVLSNTQPLLASGLGVIFGAQIPKGEWRALGLGFIGVAFVAGPSLLADDADAPQSGLLFLLASVTGVAIGNLLMKRIAHEVDALVAMGAQFAIGGLLLLAAAMLAEPAPAGLLSFRFVSVVIALAIIGTAAPYWLWFRLLARTSLARANTFTFLTPVIGVAIGIALFGERPSPWQFVGFLLIIAAVAMSRPVD